MTADAPRFPNSLITKYPLPFDGAAREAQLSALQIPERLVGLALEPGVKALPAHSLSIAETQIC
jgi:hypothetical protein